MKKTVLLVLAMFIGAALAPASLAAQDDMSADDADMGADDLGESDPMAEPEPLGPPPMPEEEMPEEIADEGGGGIDGWFRIDTDGLGTQIWVGATHDLGGLAIATDIYVVGAEAEFDLGIAFDVGPVALLPMVGIVFDFSGQRTDGLIVPQLFTIIDAGGIYFESWIQIFLNGMFNEADDGTGTIVKEMDYLYTRNFLLLGVSDDVQLGPQFELGFALTETPVNMDGDDAAIYYFPVGGRLNLAYGENNTLGLFLGYDVMGGETSESAPNNLAGRFTFIRTW